MAHLTLIASEPGHGRIICNSCGNCVTVLADQAGSMLVLLDSVHGCGA